MTQALSFQPVLKIHQMASRHAARKPRRDVGADDAHAVLLLRAWYVRRLARSPDPFSCQAVVANVGAHVP